MQKILVIGGTRYLGLDFLSLLKDSKNELFVASRKKIPTGNFIYIDRKNQKNLNKLFLQNNFDVVIDFICYSGSDSKKLYNSIILQKKIPKLILISTVYVYGTPLNINFDYCFNENNFRANLYPGSLLDRPLVTYAQGKRDMESFFMKRYEKEKLAILRFPIILGANDYTLRTHFYYNLIKNKTKINPANINSKQNYIFSIEAAKSIINFLDKENFGTFNVALDPISEKDMVKLYCEFFNYDIDKLIDLNKEVENTPFSSKFDFIIDTTKYFSIFPFDTKFKEGLNKEMIKIDS